jgi:hypothetical protein
MALARRSIEWLWLKGTLFVIFGYFLLGKGFAYLFLGELVLVVGVIIYLPSRRFTLPFTDPVLLLWTAFAFWGFCRTVPFLSVYHFDAVRDAVLWGYGTFALIIVAFINRSSQISRALNTYRKFLRWYLIVFPGLLAVSLVTLGKLLPLPWSHEVGILDLKAGDAGVDIAVAGMFMLIFSDRRTGGEKQGLSMFRIVGFIGWWMAALCVAAVNRGGIVSVILSALLVSILQARKIAWKVAAFGIVGATLAVGILFILPSDIHFGKKTLDSSKIAATIASIGGSSVQQSGHEGTMQWRLLWWRNIIHETFFGPYFWTGRGFGVNLAVADGPFSTATSEDDVSLRSPHNGSMAVLARMGVPGFAIWVALNAVFSFRLLKAQRQAARSGSLFWSRLNLWILACWFAALTNSTFDVYLEGPQGGILFWSLIGLGVAALRVQNYEARLARAQDLARTAETPELVGA